MKDCVINFSDAGQRSLFLDSVRPLQGAHRVSIVRYRPRRTDRQNRFYWPCRVHLFGDYLRDQGNGHFTDEMAHEVLKRMFLETTVVDQLTGEVLTYVRSTTELDTAEFNRYLDQVTAFLTAECGIEVPDPEHREEESCQATTA